MGRGPNQASCILFPAQAHSLRRWVHLHKTSHKSGSNDRVVCQSQHLRTFSSGLGGRLVAYHGCPSRIPHRTTASRQRPSASASVSLQTFDSSHSSASRPLSTSSGPVSSLLAPESDPEPTIGERCVLTAVPQASEAKPNEIFRTRLVYSTNRLEDVRCLTGMTLASERVPADGRSFEPSTPRDGKQRRSEEGDPSLRRGQAPKNSVMQVGESQLPRGQEVAVRDVPARGKPHVRAQVQLHCFELLQEFARSIFVRGFFFCCLISSWITTFKNGANIHGRSYEE
ncbi:hypothetical protein BDP81DRAFT_427714 [Colletotrichum phormii]|uniref:Uncharacterized protein n=1 Tax=Colletotrichum phormii TaxID=359342 RepID=A0AAI9ZRF8_9PEZI|nr:uncharacterized protein BDP81DRAFT_427714 [Colletotrichum phormii]KAK1636501.1 hypothetical protein BDP81DRAFT_427714 [Colletotrichum phormii]